MKWFIPAKTFLLGEYAAIEGKPAILLNTNPCFEIQQCNQPGLLGIHPNSPIARWWVDKNFVDFGFQWVDPYQGLGGLGASSAQFAGIFAAWHQLQSVEYSLSTLLNDYFYYAWNQQGLRPSGYDVIAQTLRECVYIDKSQACYTPLTWPFKDLAFVLLHTGQKLATHEHLQAATLPGQIDELVSIVQKGKRALEHAHSPWMIEAVNEYHHALCKQNKIAEHSLMHLELLSRHPDVLAAKGCGAMGADVLLLLVSQVKLKAFTEQLRAKHWKILATSANLYKDIELFSQYGTKMLDI